MGAMNDCPTVSIVIPAFNEVDNIPEVLNSLALQTLPANRFQVILIDNGSTDDTVAVARSFQGRLPLIVVSRPGASISALRNFGASLTQSSVLAFLDADCSVGCTWLEDCLNFAPSGAVWGAHYRVPLDASWVGKTWSDYQTREQDGGVAFLPSSNLWIHRSDFDRLGGFRESIHTSEDVDLCTRARQLGMRIVAHHSLAVVHHGTPETLRQFYRQNRWHGMDVFRMFFRNLPSLQHVNIVLLSVYTLFMFWAVLLAPIFAIPLHSWQLPLLPLLLLLLPPLVVALQRIRRSNGPLSAVPPLSVLYATYFLSRAASLTQLSHRNHR
jgi:glycosyltransferase involved in cell wall biosynthesis